MAHILRLYLRITSALSPLESLMLLAYNMFVAYWTPDPLSAIFTDPGRFNKARSLYLSVCVSDGSDLWGRIFSAVDTLAAKRPKAVG